MRDEVRRLQEDRARVLSDLADLERRMVGLKGELSGLDRALAICTGVDLPPSVGAEPKRERARNVKETVLTSVQSAGAEGITVQQLLDRAGREGVHLERGTVSSLLSRFKREGLLMMEDGKYYVPQSRAAAREAEQRTVN